MAIKSVHKGPWTVGRALRMVRGDQGLRAIAKTSGVSPAQISRMERDEVENPVVETLIRLSRGIWRNPLPLLILSRHVSGDEARRRLLELLEEGTEVHAEWGPADVRESREALTDPTTPEDVIDQLAFDLFVGEELYETAWDEAHVLMGVGEGNEVLREIAQKFPLLSPRRAELVLGYLRDQAELSRREEYGIHEAEASAEAENNNQKEIE
jgi:transcriptional regulator with XRE-family HTH domain